MMIKTYAIPALTAAILLASCGPDSTDSNQPPSLSIDSQTLAVNALDTRRVNYSASDPDGDPVSVSLNQAPTWAWLEGEELLLSPTNPDAGQHTVTLTVNDGKTSKDVNITVTVAEQAPLSALPDYKTRQLEDEVFYFVMTDRFHDGDESNNEGDPSDPLASGGYDKTKDGFYHGGDLQGLTEKLSYIEDLGATAIWLTPILKNKAIQGDSTGYHGYWTLDFTSIDPHLGGNDGLKEFIDAAHDRNLKVFFDIIVNHSADVIKYEECHNPDGSLLPGVETCEYRYLERVQQGDGYTPFIPVGEEVAKTPAWLNDTSYYHNQGESTWAGENSLYGDFVGLDDIDTDNPEVVANFTDVFKGIIRDFRPDGFRVDTVKHVNTEFWQEFTPAILDYARADDTDGTGTHGAGLEHFTLFGEVYSADPGTLSYYTTEARLPSVLDFGIQAAITTTINNNGVVAENATHPLTNLFNQDDLYNDQDSSASELLNFVGNHDMGRFASFLGDTLAWEEEALAKVDLAHAVMFFTRGAPVIYYGAEQGFIGTGDDKASRQDMMPSEVDYYNDTDVLGTTRTSAHANFTADHPLYLKWREYSRLLREHDTLRTGVQHIRPLETTNLYAISRFNESTLEEYLVVFNFNPDRRKTATLSALAPEYTPVYGTEEIITANSGDIDVQVPAADFVILKANNIADMQAPVVSEFAGPDNNVLVSGQVGFSLSIEGADARDVPTYTVNLQQSLDNGVSWQTVATDRTVPYRLYLNTVDIDNRAEVQVRAQAFNLSGDTITTGTKTIVVDHRTPTVTIDYEGQAIGKRLAVTYSNGQVKTLDANQPASFEWQGSDDALLTYYQTNGGNLVVDQPVWLSRAQVMSFANESGSNDNLESQLFLNSVGAFAGTENDAGTSPALFNQNQAASLGNLFVRGSLNDWKTTALTYANGTYSASVELPTGDIEYKFADADWSSVNIGGPISADGLVRNANPANLNQTVTQPGDYGFYLLLGDIDLDGNADEFIHLLVPEF